MNTSQLEPLYVTNGVELHRRPGTSAVYGLRHGQWVGAVLHLRGRGWHAVANGTVSIPVTSQHAGLRHILGRCPTCTCPPGTCTPAADRTCNTPKCAPCNRRCPATECQEGR